MKAMAISTVIMSQKIPSIGKDLPPSRPRSALPDFVEFCQFDQHLCLNRLILYYMVPRKEEQPNER